MMELVSRIKAVLRRTQKDTQDPQDVIVLGDIEMNTKKHEVTADGEVVIIDAKEYELLKLPYEEPEHCHDTRLSAGRHLGIRFRR